MSVTCLNCGEVLVVYYEADFDTWNFCSRKCEDEFTEYIKKEAQEYETTGKS